MNDMHPTLDSLEFLDVPGNPGRLAVRHIPVKVKKLHPDAKLPAFKTDGSLCFDIYALDNGSPHPNDECAWQYRTGLAFQFPPEWGMDIFSRSGDGFKQAIRLSNCTGIIDCDYQGEVMVSLRFDGGNTRYPVAGERIAQGRLVKKNDVQFIVVEEFDVTTERGSGGFGSTGRD